MELAKEIERSPSADATERLDELQKSGIGEEILYQDERNDKLEERGAKAIDSEDDDTDNEDKSFEKTGNGSMSNNEEDDIEIEKAIGLQNMDLNEEFPTTAKQANMTNTVYLGELPDEDTFKQISKSIQELVLTMAEQENHEARTLTFLYRIKNQDVDEEIYSSEESEIDLGQIHSRIVDNPIVMPTISESEGDFLEAESSDDFKVEGHQHVSALKNGIKYPPKYEKGSSVMISTETKGFSVEDIKNCYPNLEDVPESL